MALIMFDQENLNQLDAAIKRKITVKLIKLMAWRLSLSDISPKKKTGSFSRCRLQSKLTSLNYKLDEKEHEMNELNTRISDIENENTKLKDQLNSLQTTVSLQRSDILGKSDPWALLDVSRSASLEEIKKAYKEKVKKYNPHIVETLADDVKSMVNDSCREINLAYAALRKKFKNSNK